MFSENSEDDPILFKLLIAVIRESGDLEKPVNNAAQIKDYCQEFNNLNKHELNSDNYIKISNILLLASIFIHYFIRWYKW